ncbi:MAG: hypothetical protein RBR50_01115 [Candidatus Izemoplasmatales bacterium]|nr:hypothetical protein [Candidatus Izemoplasmatales bacterium]
MSIEQRAKQAQSLKQQAMRAYDNGDIDDAMILEKQYLQLRLSVIDEVSQEVSRQKSKTIKQVKHEVSLRPKVIRRATGIDTLDKELIPPHDYGRGKVGGFALGNFIQFVGSRGSGKSTLLMRIITNLSLYESVCWFDFEMGEMRVVDKLSQFRYNEDNLLYYNASRELSDVIEEIKFLHAMGANHFVIDSTMKLTIKGLDNIERNSQISSQLSELTSTLGINIYIINQMSQQAEENQVLKIKHGNDVEYDADFIFFVLALPKIENGKSVKDKMGQIVTDDTQRVVKCVKNRQDERLFTVYIQKSELILKPVMEVEFKIDMPQII